jgi:hypothetical protein
MTALESCKYFNPFPYFRVLVNIGVNAELLFTSGNR